MAVLRKYSGAWNQQAQYTDRALAPNPGVDPSHMHPDDPDVSRPPSGAPMTDQPPLYMTVAPEDAYEWEIDTEGVIIDTEPMDHSSEDLSVAIPSPAHAIARGRQNEQLLAPFTGRASDELYVTERPETAPVTGDLTLSSKRGTNSLPENNPPEESYPQGYRYGFYVRRWMHRTAFPSRGMWRRHDERALRHLTAASAVDSPVADQPNKYTSPFTWSRRALQHAGQQPILRRNPRAWDESILAEEDTSQETFIDYVVG